ncbi:MAG: hypothetical protein LBP87_06690 [Planctomycetaceae bacterium]|jgi:hypothetical protein|nr:hypothetical protein [Planctomycetaceae bacterium]
MSETIFEHLQIVQNERFASGVVSNCSAFDVVDNASVRADAIKWGKSPLGKQQRMQQIIDTGNDAKILKDIEYWWSKRASALSGTMFSALDRNPLERAVSSAIHHKELLEATRSPGYRQEAEKNRFQMKGMWEPPATDADIRKSEAEITKARKALEAFDKRVQKTREIVRESDQRIKKLREGASPEMQKEIDRKYLGSGKNEVGDFVLHF